MVYSRPIQASFRPADGGLRFTQVSTGVLQGDGLSTLFFSLASLDALRQAEQAMFGADGDRRDSVAMAYVDDTYMIGTRDQVQAGIDAYVQAAANIGLTVNPAKTELFAFNPVDVPC
eukprot:m.278494 g.278494  ORF g.278494 m.278494 type:complete len:117 (-) comp11101_c0_seq98:581-931(-)